MEHLHKYHTVILGTGAAGLAAAKYLLGNGVTDIALISEGLKFGTSINTGSDKQTYYKLGLYAQDQDSPEALAQTYFDGGSMHGDLALVEAANSARGFLNLVNLGVPFPRDAYGQFIGYKTDHDPLRRATSCGPYTSQEMCRVLIDFVQKKQLPLFEKMVAVKLLTIEQNQTKRACGVITLDENSEFHTFLAENVIFAVGGPGGLYKTSVYPAVHTGAIGLALAEGALAQSLPESQYGLASIKFRWNVSGTYMQVLPRFISTASDGVSDERDFLLDYFGSAAETASRTFLKGYQWPFDARKVNGGSSVIDLLVYLECVTKKRRVFLDFRSNIADLDIEQISPEAHEYLQKSAALTGTPLERLQQMNPDAIKLYKRYGIDLSSAPLEIAVCAQHNNGGLAGDIYYESLNIKHLFPIGEVNGSHGVYRPGGSALNAGQVGALRAAEAVKNRYSQTDLDYDLALAAAKQALKTLQKFAAKKGTLDNKAERSIFQERMSQCGAHIRSSAQLQTAIQDAWAQYEKLQNSGNNGNLRESLRNCQLCLAHAVYLEAGKFQIDSGTGSRGSVLVADMLHCNQQRQWEFEPENPAFRQQVLNTRYLGNGKVESGWVPRRPLPHCDDWFEKVWADFRAKKNY